MENTIGADILSNPDSYTLIANPEQIMDVYGTLFEKGNLYRTDVYLEKDIYPSKQDERFMTTSAGLVTLRGDSAWNMDINDQDFLEKVQRTTAEIKRSVENSEDGTFDKNVTIHNRVINVTYEPYIVETTEYVINELNRRMKLLQKKT